MRRMHPRIKFLEDAIGRLDDNVLTVKESGFTSREKYNLIKVYELQRADYTSELSTIKRNMFEISQRRLSFLNESK